DGVAGIRVGALCRAAGDVRHTAGRARNLVGNAIVEAGDAQSPTLQAVVVHTQFRTGADLGLQVGVAHVDLRTLTRDAVDSAVQLVQAWCFVAAAHATLERPLFRWIPDQIAARTDMAAEGVM